jgi:hypothetical protein
MPPCSHERGNITARLIGDSLTNWKKKAGGDYRIVVEYMYGNGNGKRK